MDKKSATLGLAGVRERQIPMEADHNGICKFTNVEGDDYAQVSFNLVRLIKAAIKAAVKTECNPVLDSLPQFVRQKIRQDSRLNLLHYQRDTNSTALELPYLNLAALSAPSQYVIPKALYTGNSAFELADLLQLLPGQQQSDLLIVQEVNVAELIHDENTYYCKISQEGILRLICANFVSVTNCSGGFIVKTRIGTFSFGHMQEHMTLRFFSRERSQSDEVLDGQDYLMIQDCARGKFCRIGETGESIWSKVSILQAILDPQIVHQRCPRFMTSQGYRNLGDLKAFADDLITVILEVIEDRRDVLESFRRQDIPGSESCLPLLVMTSQVNFKKPEHFRAALKLIKAIYDIYRIPGTPGNPDSTREGGTFGWMMSILEVLVELKDIYKAEGRTAVLLNIKEEQDVRVLMTLAGISVQAKASSGIIQACSIEAPEKFIHMIDSIDVDILIG